VQAANWTKNVSNAIAVRAVDKTMNNKKARLRDETSLWRAKVEPERIELSSREVNTVLSTCLVDFGLSKETRQATA
jgi:hypothetical protein